MVHKKLLRKIGMDLDYLKKQNTKSYENVERTLGKTARRTKRLRKKYKSGD